MTEDINTPLVSLDGHQKKVHIVSYHRSASNILASAGYDNAVKIWDVSRGTAIRTVEAHNDTIGSFCWNYNGDGFVTSCKDKFIRIFDARSGALSTVSLFKTTFLIFSLISSGIPSP